MRSDRRRTLPPTPTAGLYGRPAPGTNHESSRTAAMGLLPATGPLGGWSQPRRAAGIGWYLGEDLLHRLPESLGPKRANGQGSVRPGHSRGIAADRTDRHPPLASAHQQRAVPVVATGLALLSGYCRLRLLRPRGAIVHHKLCRRRQPATLWTSCTLRGASPMIWRDGGRPSPEADVHVRRAALPTRGILPQVQIHRMQAAQFADPETAAGQPGDHRPSRAEPRDPASSRRAWSDIHRAMAEDQTSWHHITRHHLAT
jgi:hypothetical protein